MSDFIGELEIKSRNLCTRLAEITNVIWQYNSMRLISNVIENPDQFIKQYLPVEMWDQLFVNDENQISIDFVCTNIITELLSNPYQLYGGKATPSQVKTVIEELRLYDACIRENFIFKRIDRIPELPPSLFHKLETRFYDNQYSITIQLTHVPILHDYVTEIFPLHEPVSRNRIEWKIRHYIRSVLGEDNYIYMELPKTDLLIRVNLHMLSSNVELIGSALSVIMTPTQIKECVCIQLGSFTYIRIKNVFNVYSQLWRCHIQEPLARFKLSKIVPLPVQDLRNLVLEYYNNQPFPSNLYFQQRKSRSH